VTARSEFLDRLGFTPDPFQVEAFDVVDQDRNVVVAAPTGSGKTLVAAYAVDRALDRGVRAFYTTPIKALSNQKYLDLVREYGSDRVGLLTGDNAINGDAPVVVMTTEVLRNMLYAGARLDSLGVVILDEVHYLQDAYRGPVWEEVIIHSPPHVRLACLSATVSNAEQLTEWIATVRGDTALVIETRRPVELDHLYLVGERSAHRLHLVPTLVNGRPNPQGTRFDIDPRSERPTARRRGEKRPGRKWRTPRRTEAIELLAERDLLPAIYFLFSRAGCDDAARQLLRDGLHLTSTDERDRIRALIGEHTAGLGPDELAVLGFDQFTAALEAGIAAHHAGMIPPFKQLVEACFTEGLVKVVFATETLALGINMPARTVVIEKMTKFTGEHHEFLTPAQYTQLTGRAGRRGIDTHGQAVVLWSPFVTFDRVASLALSRSFVLTSSFRPTYNMAVNLVRRYDQERARHLLNLSFAQYRSDADVVRSEHRRDQLEDRARQLRERIEAEFGPISELQGSFTSLDGPLDRQQTAEALSHLRPGTVVELVGDDVPERAAVLAVAFRRGGTVRARVVDADTGIWEVTPDLLSALPLEVGQLELPEPYLPASTSYAHEVAQRLARTRVRRRPRARSARSGRSAEPPALPKPVRRALKQLEQVERDLAVAARRAEGQSDSLARQFDRVITLLEERGHVRGWSLTPSGERIARIYHECDLLIAEAHEGGLLDGLGAADLAGLASCFVSEERRSSGPGAAWFPTRALRSRFDGLVEAHRRLNEAEQASRLPLTRAPDAGFVGIAHAWAAGGDLDDVLANEEVTAGDFVRTAKQLIDLLRQLASISTDAGTRRAAATAAEAVFRGVVAASSRIDDPDEDDVIVDGPITLDT
jgi:ATP-dependent RNA helicase HelY